MSNKFLILTSAFFALLACSVSTSCGEDFFSLTPDATAATPTDPAVKNPDAITYTTTFNYKDKIPSSLTPDQKEKLEAARKANPRIQSMVVERFGDFRHDLREFEASDAPKEDLWYWQKALFKQGQDGRGKPNGIHSEPAFDKTVATFPELNWVDRRTFIGAIQQDKRTINVYAKKFSGEDVGGFNPILLQDEEAVAYIDGVTQLPLALKTPRFLATYSYQAKPDSLSPPAEYEAAIQKYKEWAAHPYRSP